MKYIDLSREQKARLRRVFKVSTVTIWKALTYQTDSALARRIRTLALSAQMGGQIINPINVTDGFMPNCQTEYVHGDDGQVWCVIQTYSNGVRVEFRSNNDACSAVILHGKDTIKAYDHVVIRDWGNIAFEAQNLSDSLNA